MRILSLFAGIGGFDLAFSRAGFKLAGAVELDESCRRLLAVRFPDVPLWSDVRQVHAATECPRLGRGHWCPFCGEQGRAGHAIDCELAVLKHCPDCLPAVDVLVGGWPCQPFSVAGRRRGTDDERDLWPEFARLVGELRPRWVVGENVPGLLSIDEGHVWGRTITDLSDLGYGVCWRVLDAQHYGVPQRRRRIFLVAHLGNLAGPATVLLEPEGSTRDSAPVRETWPDIAAASADGAAEARGGGRR